MSDSMAVVIIVVGIVFIGVAILCAKKEKELSGFYKAINVCGRVWAFLTGNFLLTGVGCVIAVPILLVLMITGKGEQVAALMGTEGTSGGAFMVVLTFIICAVICLAFGLFMYKRALKKCPDQLKKGFLKDIMIIYFGLIFRLSFFFMVFVYGMMWWQSRRTEYTINGKKAYTYGNDDTLYDEYGNVVGRKSGSDQAFMTDSRYRS